jgi:nicotinate-nucleotide adenylyltransferase
MISLRKIGLYGGSFDPIHHGHLILAREALESLGLERVIFIPAGVSPHKLGRPPAPAHLRGEMVAAAVQGEERLDWNDCEIRRKGPSFAIDTVRDMQALFPDAQIFYFIGEDNLAALHTWKEISQLRRMVQFVVFSRGGSPTDHGFPVLSRRVDISSTDIRNRIASGLSARYLLPEAACHLIAQHQLYRNE